MAAKEKKRRSHIPFLGKVDPADGLLSGLCSSKY